MRSAARAGRTAALRVLVPWGTAPLALIVAMAVATPARGQPEGSAGELRVLILVPEDGGGRSAEDYQRLLLAVEAHLSAYPVTVRLLANGTNTDEALALAERERALSVAWLAADGGRLVILTPSLHDEPRQRDVPAAGEGWAARCEIMAAMLASELAPVLGGGLDDPPGSTVPVADPAGDADLVEDGSAVAETELESSAAATATAQGSTAAGTGPGIKLTVSAAYLPVRLAAEAPLLQGLGLGLGVAVGPHLELDVGLDLAQAAPLPTPDGEACLARWPVRLAAVGRLPVGPLDLGLMLGPTVEVARIRDIPVQPADPDVDRIHTVIGFSPAFRLRIHPAPWLAPFVELGGDFFFDSHRYLYDGQLLLERYPSVLRLAIGLTGVIAVR